MPYIRRKPTRAPRPRRGKRTKAGKRTYPVKRTTSNIVSRVPRGIPFPKTKNYTLVYKNPSVTLTTSGLNSFNRYNFALNNMYDFDTSNIVGNKQPLYYDTLLSGVGPYRNYKVNAWKTYIKVQNLETSRSIQMYYQPGTFNVTTDTDSLSEIENMPGVQMSLLTPIGSGTGSKVIRNYQTLRSYVRGAASDLTMQTAYNASPGTVIYSTLAFNSIDGSATAYSFQLQLTHVFYCTLFDRDATVS